MKNQFFDKPDNQARIKILADKFRGYLNNQITEETIINYILQFPPLVPEENLEMLLESILEALEQIDFWDWKKLRAETEEIVKKILIRCNEEYVFCGLGNPGGSSFRILQLLPAEYQQEKYSLEVLLEKEDCPNHLIFIDDAVASGNQVIEIFQEWLGVSKENRILKRKYVKELSEAGKQKLKNSHIYLGYLNFKTENESYILEKLNALGIAKAEMIYLNKFSKIFETNYSSNPALQYVAKQCFENIGKKIMQALYPVTEEGMKIHGWTKKRLEHAALGYNDAQQMTVYIYNVPTYTVTVLWKEVETSSFVWKPLFTRKKSSEEL